jgi:Xaa-Pro aminopeptidase
MGAERLALLKGELTRRGLDGFVVPLADEHQGEYVPPHARRLAWLTGFTGSAGTAVVLADRAALFVDGRYTLQARREAGDLFEHFHSADEPASRWIGAALPAGGKLGFDPWLHLYDQVTALREACARAGGSLVPCDDNPVDAVWSDRPGPPRAPVTIQPESFAGRSSADKRRAVADNLANDRLDAAVLADPAAIAWLLNIRGDDIAHTPVPLAFAILGADAGVDLFIDRAKLYPETLAHLGPTVRVHAPDAFAGMLAAPAWRDRRVRVDSAHGAYAISHLLEQAGAVVDRGADPCALPKACKNAVELDGCREAHRRDGAALCRFLAWLAREGGSGQIDELTAVEMAAEMRKGGRHYRGLSFPTIAGSGPNGAIVHYGVTVETNRLLRPGELFLLDSGGQYLDGTTDVTRTVAVAPEIKEPGDEIRRRFTLVLKGHIGVASAVFPTGTTGSQLDVLARRALWADGLDYDHGTGHGVGSYLSVHEGPQRISKSGGGAVLQPGMVLSNEPGYYKADSYGIRLENLIAVVEGPHPPGAERSLLAFDPLTLAPFDRVLIDPDLLTDGELDWLNAYHARVLAEIGPLVDGDTAFWLERVTRPLR